MSDHTSIAWTEAKKCPGCGLVKESGAFGRDRTTGDGLTGWCRVCRNAAGRRRYRPVTGPIRHGPLPKPARDGDKSQARHRVNHAVDVGLLPDPEDEPCADCGDAVFLSGRKRHEYDHYLGYAAEHHLDVESVCSTCHHNREELRRCG
jgi:hypothetical protein